MILFAIFLCSSGENSSWYGYRFFLFSFFQSGFSFSFFLIWFFFSFFFEFGFFIFLLSFLIVFFSITFVFVFQWWIFQPDASTNWYHLIELIGSYILLIVATNNNKSNLKLCDDFQLTWSFKQLNEYIPFRVILCWMEFYLPRKRDPHRKSE